MKQQARKEMVTNYILSHKEALYRLAYMYTKNEEDALDVVQESIYKALASIDTLREDGMIKTWLYRIVVNTAIDLLRKNKKYTCVEEETLIQSAPGSYDKYQDIDLKRALGQLESEDRLLITLRYFEDMKIQDVADVMGLNINTIKTKLYRVLKKLRIDIE